MLREDNIGRAQKSVEGWVIVVGGLHEECTEEDLYDCFAEFGAVKDIRMPLDHRTGYVKGYALMEYGSYRDAKAAVDGMNGREWMGQVLKCDFAFVKGGISSASALGSSSGGSLHEDSIPQGDARDLISRPR